MNNMFKNVKKIKVNKQAIEQEKNLFAEMHTNTNEKIFLEEIDQFFEQDSSFNCIERNDFDISDLEIGKMNDKFCNSLDIDYPKYLLLI